MEYQEDFVFDLEHRDQGFKGGFRAGKSESAVHKAIYNSMIHAGKKGALLSPTYGMTVRNLVPIFKRLNQKYNLKIKGLQAQHPSVLYIKWGSKVSEIHLDISAENHDRLNGITLAWCGLDEADKCNSGAVAEACWIQMGSRLSDPAPGEIGIRYATSTPEGYSFMYSTFEENPGPHKILYTAAMTDNYLLPDSYIESMKETIPKHLYNSYVLGEFMNLDKNIVYQDFDRKLNHSPITIDDVKPTEVIHLGMDFNSGGMSAVGSIIRDKKCYTIYENIGARNTRDLGLKLKNDHRLKDRKLVVYPDPSFIKNSSNSEQSDQAILKSMGFNCQFMNQQPLVTDRVNAVNARFCNTKDERNHFIDTKNCPLLTKAILTQTYKNGAPLKNDLLIGTTSTFIDGPVDALGYFIYTLWPVTNQNSRNIKISGF